MLLIGGKNSWLQDSPEVPMSESGAERACSSGRSGAPKRSSMMEGWREP